MDRSGSSLSLLFPSMGEDDMFQRDNTAVIQRTAVQRRSKRMENENGNEDNTTREKYNRIFF